MAEALLLDQQPVPELCARRFEGGKGFARPLGVRPNRGKESGGDKEQHRTRHTAVRESTVPTILPTLAH